MPSLPNIGPIIIGDSSNNLHACHMIYFVQSPTDKKLGALVEDVYVTRVDSQKTTGSKVREPH